MKRALIALAIVAAALCSTSTAADAATTTISARFDRSSTDPNTNRTLSGTVTPKTKLPTVMVQRYVGGRWTDFRKVAVSTSTGSYRTTIKIANPGTHRFRVTSPGKSIASKSAYLRVWSNTYLHDLRWVDSSYCCWSKTSVTMNTKTYPYSLKHDDAGATWLEYDLQRKFERFSSVVGVTDSSKAGAVVNYRITADGVQIASGTASLGAPVAVDVSVKGALRLRIAFSKAGGTSYSPAWGNAVIRR